MKQLMNVSEDMKRCIQECNTCRDVCLNMAATHCLEKGGEHVAPPHFRLMLDCAEICGVSAAFMLRNSAHHKLTCGVCAQICERCAEDCKRVGDMDACVDACRRCAESCRKMAA
jgi:hypothetical protein